MIIALSASYVRQEVSLPIPDNVSSVLREPCPPILALNHVSLAHAVPSLISILHLVFRARRVTSRVAAACVNPALPERSLQMAVHAAV